MADPLDLDRDLDTLAARRVLFGHQSVGGNILDGVRALLQHRGRQLRIVEHAGGPLDERADNAGPDPAPDPAATGLVLHARVGRNQDPLSKLNAFRMLLEAGPEVDVALMKVCYIDIDHSTDVDALFASYHQTLTDLERRHPATTFIAVTAPLRHTPSGLGVTARELLGRPNRSKRDNLARHRFNAHVRRAYAGRPVFDLAAAEATWPDGRREAFRYRGEQGESLAGAYTDDGGHLNQAGREAVARAFVRSLAAAISRRPGR